MTHETRLLYRFLHLTRHRILTFSTRTLRDDIITGGKLGFSSLLCRFQLILGADDDRYMIWLDIDNTLYSASAGISHAMGIRIHGEAHLLMLQGWSTLIVRCTQSVLRLTRASRRRGVGTSSQIPLRIRSRHSGSRAAPRNRCVRVS